MTDGEKGGLGMDKKEASDIFGSFIALVFLTPFIGGLLADRVLGYRLSVVIGGVLMGLGYMGLSLPGMTAFYVSLLLIIVGNGFFKPNISTLLGNLYSAPEQGFGLQYFLHGNQYWRLYLQFFCCLPAQQLWLGQCFYGRRHRDDHRGHYFYFRQQTLFERRCKEAYAKGRHVIGKNFFYCPFACLYCRIYWLDIAG
jgi:hypothetical protein